jgi:hypothetical protein
VPPPPPPPSPLPIRLLLHLLTHPAQRPCISSLLSVTKIVLQYEVVRGIDSHTLTHPASPPPLGRVPRFYTAFQSGDVKPSNFVCKYQEVTDVPSSSKQPVESVKHPGQRLLG